MQESLVIKGEKRVSPPPYGKGKGKNKWGVEYPFRWIYSNKWQGHGQGQWWMLGVWAQRPNCIWQGGNQDLKILNTGLWHHPTDMPWMVQISFGKKKNTLSSWSKLLGHLRRTWHAPLSRGSPSENKESAIHLIWEANARICSATWIKTLVHRVINFEFLSVWIFSDHLLLLPWLWTPPPHQQGSTFWW